MFTAPPAHAAHPEPSAPACSGLGTGGGITVLALPARALPRSHPPTGPSSAGLYLHRNILATILTVCLAKLPSSAVFQPKFDL